jgi:glycosyltransferase involved in cell wall biosynthesis
MIETLMISTGLPAAPMTGGRVRTDQLARALAQLGPVTIAGFVLEGEPQPVLEPPLRGVAVRWEPPPLYVRMNSSDEIESARAYELLATGVPEPWIVSGYESAALREEVRRICARGVDLVVVDHTLMGAYLANVPEGVPTVLDLHNVHWRMASRDAERGTEDAREAERVGAYERSLIEAADLTLVVSDADAAAARKLAPDARIEVVPNGVDTDLFTPTAAAPEHAYLLFTGLMNYRPNVEAVEWFADEVLPLLDEGVLNVVGSTPAPEVEALAGERVAVHGEVPDMRPYQSRAEVVVVPLLSGGGTRLKLLEAAACGNAIVSTSIGAEGLGLEPGTELLVADSAPEFAEAVAAVLADGRLRECLGRNARRAAERYRWAAIGERLVELVGPLAADHVAAPAKEP